VGLGIFDRIWALGMKRSLLVEADGGPLAVVIAGANVPDAQLLAATIEAVVLERRSVEAGWSGQHLWRLPHTEMRATLIPARRQPEAVRGTKPAHSRDLPAISNVCQSQSKRRLTGRVQHGERCQREANAVRFRGRSAAHRTRSTQSRSAAPPPDKERLSCGRRRTTATKQPFVFLELTVGGFLRAQLREKRAHEREDQANPVATEGHPMIETGERDEGRVRHRSSCFVHAVVR
jgi:hypothetical protein